MKLVFMGTPDFAVGCLEALIAAGHDVLAVFSQPDKPVGRKQTMTPPACKVCAQAHHIPVYQPATLKDGAAEKLMNQLNPDCVVVVAYGKLIQASMLHMPRYGYINVHASLLPKYRGAAPIQWAIVDGQSETGVCTMQLDEGMDTGDILECVSTPIGAEETAGELFDRLSDLGAKLIVSTLQKAENGTLHPVQQNHEQATYAAVIDKSMAQMDFNKDAQTLHNLVRGFSPWPIAYTMFNGKRLKIYSSRIGGGTQAPSGTILKTNHGIEVACGSGSSLILQEIQAEGSKRMPAVEWIKGHPTAVGARLG